MRAYAPPTEAQRKARQRSWRIRCLRALYEQASMLTGDRRVMAQSAIDAELISLGAESQRARDEQKWAEWAALDCDVAT